jgi:hypothetical protein
MPQTGQAILTASAAPARRSDAGALIFPELSAVEHILIDPNGRQHVLLRANGIALQLKIDGADIINEPVTLTIVTGAVSLLGRTASQLTHLRRILSTHTASASSVSHWTARTLNRRDGLIVFDSMTAGGTEREAGTILFGAEAVQRDWRRGSLRQRIRRDKLRGEEFVFGGYRKLLK